MQSKRWSSFTAWLALTALVSASVGSAQLHHNQIHNNHLNVQRAAEPVGHVEARSPAPTSPPAIDSRNHAAHHHQRDLAPTPVFKQFERRRASLHERLIFPVGTDTSSSDAAQTSDAAASSSLQDSISSSIQASITSSIQASITSSIQASITASLSSKSAEIAASKSAASAAAAASAFTSSLLAAQSSLFASITSSILATTVTSTTTTAPTPTISAADSSGTGSGDSHTSLIIGVSVVGGAALLGLAAFLWMKFGNKRSGYEDDDHDIRWPELRSEGDSAAMHPLPARRTGGAGFDMGGESDNGHDRDMIENDGAYGRNSFTGSTTALGAGGAAYGGGGAGYGAYGTGNAAYHDSVVDTNSAPGYASQAGYYDQYGHDAGSNPYADTHAASAGYGNAPMTTQGYYDHSPAAVADPHAPGGYVQDVYQQHSNVSPPMQATHHTGYGGQHM
ncbi:hypothetical protein OC846_000103 [Tilletia horrida]|uniref:Mid2 domain-containing protein n=1 Tax=Tilletia horrida TaxID=155126 RepID=A0AAN6GYP3_9BASI|nr:hypothetical protein OC846_000103 [Tilletia horrida]